MKRLAQFLSIALLLAVTALSVPLVLGFLNRWHPALDSFAHFRLHLAFLLAAASALLLATAYRREAAIGLLLAFGAFAATPGTAVNDLLGHQAQAEPRPDDRPVYRLLQLNARFDNPEPGRFLSLIARVRPDIVTVNEASEQWRERLQALAATYPHSVICPAPGSIGGSAILSRRPFAEGPSPQCHDEGKLAAARIDLGGDVATVIALHLEWPWPYAQPLQVAALLPALSHAGPNTLLAGDFNATRWSQTFRGLAAAARLRDAGPVGPSFLPYPLPDAARRAAGLAIDHVLAGDGVAVHGLSRQPDVGSDHLPVLVEFSLRRHGSGGAPELALPLPADLARL